MKIRSLSGLLWLLIVGALALAACGSDPAPTSVTRQPLPTRTNPPIVAAVEISINTPTGSLSAQVAAEQPPSLPETTDAPLATSAPALRAAAPTDTPTTPPATPAFSQHLVQPGETLLGIATKYGISMAAVQLANDMGSSINLLAGQTLAIPGSTQWLKESYFWVVHVIHPGETLVGLASKYGLTVDEILHVNAIADPDLIQVDRQLVMPVSQLVTLTRPLPTATAAHVADAPAAVNAQAAQAPEQSESASESAPPEAAPPPPPAVPAPSMPAGPAEWTAYILARINQARTEHGLGAFTLVSELSQAAQAHAADCARRGWGSHVGSDGAVLRTRLERVGYQGKSSGENWVQARNAERAFDWWYGEIPPNDPHRRNILSPRYTEIGIGIVQSGWGYIFVTDFGRR